MPTYLYECKDHGKMNVIKPMRMSDDAEPCDECGKDMKKLLNFEGQIMGATDKGPEYNPAFGKVIHNKHELRNELRRIEGETGKEYVEVGNETLKTISKQRKSVDKEEAIKELRYRIKHG